MTSHPIHLSLNAPPAQVLEVSIALANAPYQGTAGRLMATAVATSGAFVAVLYASLAGWNPAHAIIVAALAVWATFIAQWLAAKVQRKSFLASLQASAQRTDPTPITLSATGLSLEARTFPWPRITHIARRPGMILLHFSASDAMLIRDADLPPSLPPDTLLAQLDHWRKAQP